MSTAYSALTRKDVERIIELRKQGLGAFKIARLLDKNHSTVKHVVAGRNWRWLTGGKIEVER